MEAANKGAAEAGVTSIGLNIQLTEEQKPNPYSTLSISFNHFFARKVMLAKYATAFIAMPGGIGTLDELTEILCLIQTHKMRPFPVILYGSNHWGGLLDWMRHTMLAHGYIEADDLGLLVVCNTVDEVVTTVKEWYDRQELAVGRAADSMRRRSGSRVADHQSTDAGQKKSSE